MEYAIKANNGGFLVILENDYRFEEIPTGKALFASEDEARNAAEPFHSATGGFKIVPVGKGVITAGEFDELTCTCGNTSFSDGFYPCNEKGETVEPTDEEWPAPFRYKCERCGAQWFKPSAFKHSPGPWEAVTTYPATGGMFFELKDNSGFALLRIRGGKIPTKADAALMAKAPALLMALKNLADAVTADIGAELEHQDEKNNAGHEENCVLCQALAIIEELKGK